MSAERTLLAGIAAALTAAGAIAKLADGPRVLLAKLGWDLPPGVDDIGLAGLDLARLGDRLTAWMTLETDPATSTDTRALALAELAEAVVAMLADLGALRLQAPQDYLDRSGIEDELLARLFDLYLIQAAAVASRLTFDVAALLGWFELQRHAADPTRFQVAHLRHVVHWDRIPLLFTDPVGLLRQSYGWGTANFDADALVIRLGGVLQHFAAEARRRELPAIPLARLHGGAPPHRPQTQLFLPLLGASGSVTGEVGISLFGLPPTALDGDDGGLGLAPYAAGGASLRLPLSSTLSVGMSAQADLGSGLALVLRPGSDPALRTGLNQPQAGAAAPGAALQLDLTLAMPPGAAAMPLLAAGGARIEAASVALVVSVQVDDHGTDATLQLQVKGGRLILKPEGLPFLEEATPTDGLTAAADVDLAWSHRAGVRLDGRAELKTRRAIGRRLGPVTLDVLGLGLATSGDGVALTATVDATVTLGPVRLVVEQLGVRAALAPGLGNLGSADLTIRPIPPSGIGVIIDAPTVVGGGYLFFDPQKEEYGGVLQLEIAETIAAKAIGLLTTRLPDGAKGYSLVVIITAEGFAPIQLGFGFTLTGIGGLLGVNRTVLVDVLRSGVKNGTLGSILFPADPVRNAPQIVSDLRAVFPPVRDRYIFGPMAIIAWGAPTILTLELALLLELPEPVRLIILGRLQAVLPDADHALIRVRMDAIGVIDFDQQEVALDATLYDSRILAFALTGAMALRASWGRRPNFVLAVGGFNPRFPPPAGFPRLDRLALSLGDGDNPRLRFESYLALTSNTAQFGARLDFSYSAAGFTLAGLLGFDALFQFAPFAFIADVSAMVALKRGGSTLMGVFLDMTLAGPAPWHIRGVATFKVLFFKVSIRFDHRFGREEPPPAPPPIDVLALLAEALGDRRNWSSALPRGRRAIVSLREAQTTPAALWVHPLAELTVRQRVAPLNRPVTKFGNTPLGAATTFTVVVSSSANTPLPLAATPIQDAFAPAQYQEMSDDEKLTRPAFEAQDAGLRFDVEEAVAYQYEALPDTTIEYETLMIDPTRPAEPATAAAPYTLSVLALAAVARLGAAGQAAIRRSGAARYRPLARAA